MGYKPVVFSYVLLLAVSAYALYDLGLSFSSDNPLLYAVISYGLIFLTAVVGCAKFGLDVNGDKLDRFHWILCWLDTSLVVAFIAAEAMLMYGLTPYQNILLLIGICILPAKVLLTKKGQNKANGLVLFLGILATIIVAIMNMNIWGVVGCAALLFGRIQVSGDSEDVEYDPTKDMQKDELFVTSYAIYGFCMHFFLSKKSMPEESLPVGL